MTIETKNGQERQSEDAMRMEQALLGCLIRHPELIAEVEIDLIEDFSTTQHRSLWQILLKLDADGTKPDMEILAVESDVDIAYIADLLDRGLRENFCRYVQHVQQAAAERRFKRLQEELSGCPREDRPLILEQMQCLLESKDSSAWRKLFHSWHEFENAPPMEFAIEGFLQAGGTTFITGLPGHSKTLVMLAMAKALLDCEPLFGYFKVPRPSKRVLYLIPESTLPPFWTRVKLFGLEEYARKDKLLIRTLSSQQSISLSDPRLLKAAEGSDVFLDTAVRFMAGAENDVESAREFANTLFGLLSAGARTITGAHHAPKAFSTQEFMNLENVLRGSGDLGAAICTAWGLRQIDAARNRIFVQNVKPRDFQPCEPFIIEGRPHLDQTGHFKMMELPGHAGEMRAHIGKRGAPGLPHKAELQRKAREMRDERMSTRQIADRLGIGRSTVSRLLASPVPELSQVGTALGTDEESGTGRASA